MPFTVEPLSMYRQLSRHPIGSATRLEIGHVWRQEDPGIRRLSRIVREVGGVRAVLLREVERAFIIADLSGYTALTETHGDMHAATVVARFTQMVNSRYGAGWNSSSVCDEVLIAAQEVAQAVQMALELRDALEQEPLFPTIRAGLHVGTVVEDGEHYVGSALNLTARVASYARGGQVLCTEPVALRSAGISEVTCQPLGPVRAAYRLAVKQKRIKPHMVSYFPMPTFSNARKGFFEPEDFEAFVQHLPADYADPARFAYATGWRKGEIVSLTWEQIDHAAREVRLYDSKNGEGRTLALDGDAWTIIERRWQARVYTDRRTKQTHVSPLVFHTKGRPIGDIRKAWNAALEAAGLSRGSKLFHDLRRSRVRDMIRAGVLQSVAMSISGHKTVSPFLRYNITDGKDQRDALRRTAALRRERLATAHQTPTVTPLRTVHA